jgi:hypothetical protein
MSWLSSTMPPGLLIGWLFGPGDSRHTGSPTQVEQGPGPGCGTGGDADSPSPAVYRVGPIRASVKVAWSRNRPSHQGTPVDSGTTLSATRCRSSSDSRSLRPMTRAACGLL